jgi:hypothetical protein
VIFDELDLRTDLKLEFSFSDDLDVEWAGIPIGFSESVNSYYLLKREIFHRNDTVGDLTEIPEDLEKLRLNLFFLERGYFSCNERRYRLSWKRNFIFFKKKVNYIPIVQSPDGKVKWKSAEYAFEKRR